MIASIRGELIDVSASFVVIEAGGIGYKISMTDRDISRLSIPLPNTPGAECRVLTHHAVREDSETLYGFIDADDLVMFEHLLTVSGIGPKSALSILTIASSATLASAIVAEKPEYLTTAAGIGKKTAEKIVRELAGKVTAPENAASVELESDSEVRLALVAMGYSDREALEALQSISKDITETRARLRAALQAVGRK